MTTKDQAEQIRLELRENKLLCPEGHGGELLQHECGRVIRCKGCSGGDAVYIYANMRLASALEPAAAS